MFKQFNQTIKYGLYISAVLAAVLIPANLVLAQQCPANTEASTTQAILVGEITNPGSDPNLTVWFEYGTTTNLGNSTPQQSQNGAGLFCYTLTNLTPGTTYYYRAMARNSAGSDSGEIKSFTTATLPQTTPATLPQTTPQVAGAATNVSTGLTNNIFLDSFILPLLSTLLIIWLLRAKIVNLEQWLDKKKKTHQLYKSEKLLNDRLTKIKLQIKE
ncbi:MAG: hypothetical protein ACPLW9_02825 [Minisyncoccales bacterium]